MPQYSVIVLYPPINMKRENCCMDKVTNYDVWIETEAKKFGGKWTGRGMDVRNPAAMIRDQSFIFKTKQQANSFANVIKERKGFQVSVLSL